MNITGTIINYYFHCKRQCWLFVRRINLEDNSEDVHIGRVLHELKRADGKTDREVTVDNVKIDRITKEYIIETKKSDADLTAATWQLLYYLKKLKDKGVERKGRLEVEEKNKQDRKVHMVELTAEKEQQLEALEGQIEEFLLIDRAPAVETGPKCKKCAYYEYCFL